MKYAVYTGTRNLYRHMVPAVKSLLMNSDVNKVYLLIEDDAFPEYLPPEVECINVSGQKYFRHDGANMKTPFSYMAMMRAALCKVFPDIDTILSLDVDTIVDKDISDIWDIPLDGYYFAACHETHKSHDGLLYTNAGVVLFNLKKLRDGKADEVIDVLNTTQYTWVDQDVFNYLCQGRIYELPSDYNDNDWTIRPNAVKIKHYAGIKPWNKLPYYTKYDKIPWSEIRKGKRPMKILIAVPTYETITPETFKSIYGLDRAGCDCVFDFIRGYDCATARNSIAQRAMDEGADYVLMVDNDVVLPPVALAQLLEDQKDICFGFYPCRNAANVYDGLMSVYKMGEHNYTKKYTDTELSALADQGVHKLEIHGGGMGCALIRTEVFRKIKYPWFYWVNYGDGGILSEDLYFCEQCKKNKIPIYVDTRVSCGHQFRRIQWAKGVS